MSKIFLSYDEQIEKLKNEKNLQIDDEVYAKEILRQTSYYSLIGGYKDIFKNPTTKRYKDGTRFEDIVELYYFDEALLFCISLYLQIISWKFDLWYNGIVPKKCCLKER